MNQSDEPFSNPFFVPNNPTNDLDDETNAGDDPTSLREGELRAAEARRKASRGRRERVKEKIKRRDFKNIDSPERTRARVDRVLSDPIAAKEIDLPVAESLGIADEEFDESVLERIINGENFLGASFFDLGKRASRCIARIDIRTPEGRSGFGTGSMVTSRLLMTNNHVLPKKEWAQRSTVTFDFEDDIDGNPRPTVTFKLDPDAFYVTDKGIDFTIVAVKEISSQPPGIPLSDYGFNPLDKSPGKITIGECINIVQHPSGMHKQVVLQENRLLDLPKDAPDWLHYESDTLPGSSGAPLFNNRWEVVGLHHAGWAERDDQGRILTKDGRVWEKSMGEGAVNWLGNEGARISRVVLKTEELARAQEGFTAEKEKLLDELINPPKLGAIVTPVGPTSPQTLETTEKPVANKPAAPKTDAGQTAGARKDLINQSSGLDNAVSERKTAPAKENLQENLQETGKVQNKDEANNNAGGSVQLTIPLHITIQLGSPVSGANQLGGVISAGAGATEAFGGAAEFDDLEAIQIDPDYSNREGFDPQFLGVEVALPELTDAQRRVAALNALAREGEDPTLLPYNHFSLVMNRKRRMAYYTACNIDGERWVKIKRIDRDKWSVDPRIPILEQTGERHYAHRKIDRGHLVRREDPNWGGSFDEAKKANDDTFHFTNCTPQHSDFNQRRDSWQGIEHFILESAKTAKRRINLFTGPIFAKDDPELNGVKVPMAFWKIVVFKTADDTLSASAYVLEQGNLIEDILEATFEAETFQVPVQEIIDRTGLDFSSLVQFDALGQSDGLEATEAMNLESSSPAARIPLNSYGDIQI